jgi:hypothetical protein
MSEIFKFYALSIARPISVFLNGRWKRRNMKHNVLVSEAGSFLGVSYVRLNMNTDALHVLSSMVAGCFLDKRIFCLFLALLHMFITFKVSVCIRLT